MILCLRIQRHASRGLLRRSREGGGAEGLEVRLRVEVERILGGPLLYRLPPVGTRSGPEVGQVSFSSRRRSQTMRGHQRKNLHWHDKPVDV